MKIAGNSTTMTDLYWDRDVRELARTYQAANVTSDEVGFTVSGDHLARIRQHESQGAPLATFWANGGESDGPDCD